MPQIPFVLDVFGTLRAAVKLQADTGVGQKELTDRAAQAKAADSAALAAALAGTALGEGGAVAVNAMVENETSLPKYTQPGVSNPPGVASTPAPHLNAMGVTASGNYQQANTGNPKPNPSGQVSRSNPMGL